jgi:hypothetical protein
MVRRVVLEEERGGYEMRRKGRGGCSGEGEGVMQSTGESRVLRSSATCRRGEEQRRDETKRRWRRNKTARGQDDSSEVSGFRGVSYRSSLTV